MRRVGRPADCLRRSHHAITVAIVFVAGAAGCGGESQSDGMPEDIQGVGELRGGSSAPLAQCSDWREGTVEERLATVEDLNDQLTPQDVADPAPALPDADAYRVLDRACEPEYAAGFRLYRLYANAAAFAPLRTEPAE